MKKLLPLLLLIVSLSIEAQIPSYYNDVNLNLSGSALKDELATKIISTHTNFLSYTPGVWNALKQTDLDPTNSSRVLLIYGWNDTDSDITNDRTRGRDDNGGGSGVWNREHVYSKSLASPNLGTSGPGADAHNLRPCDAQRNSSRSNRKFAAGSGTPSYITAQGHWFPGDEWKGDVARMMMYMYLRYGNQTLPTNVGVGNAVVTDPNMIDLFLQWNAEDPVSDLEKQRNPVLETEQGNRNPFIDNPALATQIWGGPQAEDLFGSTGGSDTQAPSNPSALIASNITSTSVDLAWSASTDNVGVTGYTIYNGSTQIGTSTSTSYNVTGLTAGTTYTFYVRAFDAAANTSGNSNGANVTTTTGGGSGSGTATELIISEYVEGSSYNKAIEIANFTGSTVDLSSYSLRKTTNGNNSWSSTLNLSGQLANGQVYVVAHGSASTAITEAANITNNGVTNFNGNDAVALFKNSSLIDVVGTPSSTSNFGKDVTLRRKSSVTSPNTTYATSEWDTFASNTSSGLGTHSIDGGTEPTPDTQAPTIPSSLVASNTTQTTVNLAWSASSDNTAVTGYDVYRGSTKIATVTSTSYNATSLSANTTYSFTVRAFDAAGNVSNSSNSVNVTTLPTPDTQAPSTPTGLIASNTTQTSVSLAWSSSTDNTGVTGYDVYRGSTKLATVTTTSYNVSGLTANTTYSFTVRALDAAGNVSNSSNSVSVTTLPSSVSYCASIGNNVNYEYIDNVAIGGISNSTSANGGYGNFTSQTGNLSYGSNTIVVSAGFTGSSYTENWKVWIDFNQNGTFETSEEVVSGSSSSSGNLSYTFNVPTSANVGATRMRVSMKWNGAPTACETFSYGEVEDYTVNIGSSARIEFNPLAAIEIDGELGNEEPIFDATVYPNPAVNFVNINLRDDRDATYRIVNYIGQTLESGSVERRIDLTNLQTGVYILEVSDGQRSFTKRIVKK
ncbi:endonuclease [Tenacibaculum sp. 190524A05c]|uniref:endonuclease n=1 Tax=Tenacibaculum platacis TaxID=3137852 RepID=UPI0032B106CC